LAHSRRGFLQASGILLSYTLAGESLLLSPRAARAAQLPYEVITAGEAETLEGLCDAMVPGAREAGIAHYIDKQLAQAPQGDSLLMLKYLGVPAADFGGFYSAVLASARKLAQARHDRSWRELDDAQASALLAGMASDGVPGWEGPPASFAFFVLRADACDVVYGTEEGFARLGIPYMAHLSPAQPW
jgi:hypothetical protein